MGGRPHEQACRTADSLAIEHLTGGLARAITHVGTHDWPGSVQLRATTTFDDVGGSLDLPHGGRRTRLEMDEDRRTTKRGKFGAVKHVYPRDTMAELRTWSEAAIADRLPHGRLLYWT